MDGKENGRGSGQEQAELSSASRHGQEDPRNPPGGWALPRREIRPTLTGFRALSRPWQAAPCLSPEMLGGLACPGWLEHRGRGFKAGGAGHI